VFLQYADFYQFPHITVFRSWGHLLELLESAVRQKLQFYYFCVCFQLFDSRPKNLMEISAKMQAANVKIMADLKATWNLAFRRMFSDIEPGGRQVGRCVVVCGSE
jgi:hypothetical protein